MFCLLTVRDDDAFRGAVLFYKQQWCLLPIVGNPEPVSDVTDRSFVGVSGDSIQQVAHCCFAVC